MWVKYHTSHDNKAIFSGEISEVYWVIDSTATNDDFPTTCTSSDSGPAEVSENLLAWKSPQYSGAVIRQTFGAPLLSSTPVSCTQKTSNQSKAFIENTTVELSVSYPSKTITIQDLQVDAEVNPSSLQVRIKSSKTDSFRQGCFIYLGRGQAPLCPVLAILAYLHLRGPSSDPLFMDTHGQPLTRSCLSSFIQSVLQGAGIPGQFSGHSFRIGAATTTAQCSIPDHLIKTMGRWSSDAYQLYVRTPVESILEVSGGLLQ